MTIFERSFLPTLSMLSGRCRGTRRDPTPAGRSRLCGDAVCVWRVQNIDAAAEQLSDLVLRGVLTPGC
jgi:hypothetical protein